MKNDPSYPATFATEQLTYYNSGMDEVDASSEYQNARNPHSASLHVHWLVLVFILFLLATLGYMIFQNYILQNKLTLTKLAHQSVQVFPTPSPIINWKTYKNDLFEFNYPSFLPDITLKDKIYGETGPDIYETSYLDPNQAGGGPGYTVSLRVIGPMENVKKLTLEDWEKDNVENETAYGEPRPKPDIKYMIVDARQVALATRTQTDYSSPTEYILSFLNGSQVYEVTYELFTNNEGTKNYSAGFDQIRSTFKFNFPPPIYCPKIYTDPTYKITVNCPSGWNISFSHDSSQTPYFLLRPKNAYNVPNLINHYTPEVNIGGGSVYSTSGTLCTDTNYSPVLPISTTINGKIITLHPCQAWDNLYEFNYKIEGLKVDLPSRSDSTSAYITVSYSSPADLQQIIQIISSIKY